MPPLSDDALTPAAPQDAAFMAQALRLAEEAWGRTSPNPMVGCVIVKDGEVIGRGYHKKAGLPHAEVEAFADADARGHEVAGATLYVTLEPCAFFGRTPPCADACVSRRVGRVVIGTLDPHPKVDGAGARRLLEAGIAVTVGVQEEACRQIAAPFFTRVLRGRPHVTAKVAMSLDGKIATRTGDSFPLTGEAARQRVHQLRDRVDGIMVGRVTAERDDPRLTCRLPPELAAEGGPRDPVRIVLDTNLRLPLTHRIMGLEASGASSAPTWLAAAEDAEVATGTLESLDALGVTVIRCPRDGHGRLDLVWLLGALADRGLNSLLVEGGGALLSSLLERGLIDVWVAHVAPRLIGGLEATSPLSGEGAETVAQATLTRRIRTRRLGDDVELIAPVQGDVYGLD